MSARDYSISPHLGRDMEKLRRRSLIVGMVALVVCLIGAMFRPDQ